MDDQLCQESERSAVRHYREEAKDLLRAVRQGEPAAWSRARAALGERAAQRFVLADALHVVALEHGFKSWPEVKRVGAGPAHDRSGEAVARTVPTGAGGGRGAKGAGAATSVGAEPVAHLDLRLLEAPTRPPARRGPTDDPQRTAHRSLPADAPWAQALAAIHAKDAATLRTLLVLHPELVHENPGLTLAEAVAQPEAGRVPRSVVDVLVEAGSDLAIPLIYAASFNNAELLGWLLDAGADPTDVPGWGVTAVQAAVYHGCREATDVLYERGDTTPGAFYLTAACGDLEALGRWFDLGGRLRPVPRSARPDLSRVGWPARPALRDDPADVLAEALALAAHLGRSRACELLLYHGADPARPAFYGVTALHLAASLGRRATIRLLVRAGAPLDVRDDLHQGTPLDWAMDRGVTDDRVMTMLAQRG